MQGVIWSEARPLALLDYDLLAEGDVIGPYRIVEIRPDGLIAQREDERVFVPLDRGIEMALDPPSHATPPTTLLPERYQAGMSCGRRG